MNDVNRLAAARRRNDSYIAVPAAVYNFDELADIYNAGRVDYIVPMPMNGRRMEEYVRHYDVSLEASVVAVTPEGEPGGLGMLGLRDTRAWITRLGVMPNGRGRHLGLFITETLLMEAEARGVQNTQLEVIVGNVPAHRLFLKLGFAETRELLVLRRPPGMPSEENIATLDGVEVSPLSDEAIADCLDARDDSPSWIEETCSLRTVGNLVGLRVTLPPQNGSGTRTGWIIASKAAFQLSHFVLGGSSQVALAALVALHRQFPKHDTKLENLPADSPLWPHFQQAGYLDTFRRTEMHKNHAQR